MFTSASSILLSNIRAARHASKQKKAHKQYPASITTSQILLQAAAKHGFTATHIDEYFDDNDRNQIPRILTLIFKK
jgi:hypothetical protein